MDFYEVLEQALDILRRRGRVAYRALKLQFNLDDEQLEALKDELIHAQKLAADEDGRVLVWAGEGGAPSTPVQPTPQEGHAAPGRPAASRSLPPWGRTAPAHGDVLRRGGLHCPLPPA